MSKTVNPPPDFTCATGEVRYLAANGDDGNDGKSPETAWRSVARLNAGLPAGGTARLRRGDVFYGTLEVKGGDRPRPPHGSHVVRGGAKAGHLVHQEPARRSGNLGFEVSEL